MPRPNDVGVGVAVVIIRPDGCVLLLKRKGAHGAGRWSLPGGWIDRPDSSIRAACAREVWEECGIKIPPAFFHRLTETKSEYDAEGFSAITLFYVVKIMQGEADSIKRCEPEKCSEMRWFSLTMLPTNLFGGTADALRALAYRHD